MNNEYKKAVELLSEADHGVAFTGAGISIESGIPVFRGPNGLWSKYDPTVLELQYFYNNPAHAWSVIKEIFYDYYGKVEPNHAHRVLGWLEQKGYLKSVITQNIDNLHQEGGSSNVLEFHGTYMKMECASCGRKFDVEEVSLQLEIPSCPECGGLLKPDFIFFGEAIPEPAGSKSFSESEQTDLMLVVGTTGDVMPASMLPYKAKENGATIIEVNVKPSAYTDSITDIYLEGKATEVMGHLYDGLSGDDAAFEG